jgi:hypothetical protein
MDFLPETASRNKSARIWYMKSDSTVLYRATFMPNDLIPFYRSLDPLPGPYTVHIEWTEE